MGQYHHLVNATAREYFDGYNLGGGLKAWEQCAGGVPAALTALLAHNPGNMPADLGQHPMVGKWAGHKLLIIGDYAGDGDTPDYDLPMPESELYSYCCKEPTREALGRHLKGYELKIALIRELNEWRAMVNKHGALTERAGSMAGLVEHVFSIRYCGDRWKTAVPVKPYAVRGKDGHLHYELSDTVLRDKDHLGYVWRMLGLGGHRDGPPINPNKLPEGLKKWPWDRAPADLSWHNMTDAMGDDGQTRVFANLDRREFFSPAALGEQPTTAGIMRAADPGAVVRHAFDMMIGSQGPQSNVREGGGSGMGSATALYAMLLHPEPRGGGDIDSDDFKEVGRWRYQRLLLTSEVEDGLFPTTREVEANFTNITDKVLSSLATLAAV